MNKHNLINELKTKHNGRATIMMNDIIIIFPSLINIKINNNEFNNIQEVIIKEDNSVYLMEELEGEQFIVKSYNLEEIQEVN